MKVVRTNILLPMIEETYRQEYAEYARKGFRFSDAGAAIPGGEKCEREIFYDFTIPERKSLLSSGSLVMFDDGRLHESDIRRRLRLVLRSPERELTDPEFNGRGKIDNQVMWSHIKTAIAEFLTVAEEKPIDPVLELKSVNEFQFQMMARTGKVLQYYYDQVQLYLYHTKAPCAFIIVKNRNSIGDERGTIPFLEFIVYQDEERQAAIRKGLIDLKKKVEAKELPDRPFLRESSKCAFCRYKHVCWEGIATDDDIPLDEEVVAPSDEIVESAVKVYEVTARKIAILEEQLAEAEQVIKTWFKATNSEELLVDGIRATFTRSVRSTLDTEKIRAALPAELYAKIAEPNRKLLEAAVEERLLDAAILDLEIKSDKVTERLTVKGEEKEKRTRKRTTKRRKHD